jgi:hypothetical protein
VRALEQAGFRVEEPPEGWLYKGWRGDVMVDLIHAPRGRAREQEEVAERACWAG